MFCKFVTWSGKNIYPKSEEDILLVQQQTGASREKAVAALDQSDGEVARAILKLTS